MRNTIASICNRPVMPAAPETTAAVAKLTRRAYVGGLIVVEQLSGGRRAPAGFITVDDLPEALSGQSGEPAGTAARKRAREVAIRK